MSVATQSILHEEARFTDDSVSAIVTTPDTVYLGGDFTFAGRRTGNWASINIVTGQPTEEFPKVYGGFNTCMPDGAGGWYISGAFAWVGTMPNGGETWSHGTQHPVMWSPVNLSGSARVYLYDNWTKVRVIATVPIAGGGYMWNIPAAELVGSTYRIRVQSLTYPTIQDYSNTVFSIVP